MPAALSQSSVFSFPDFSPTATLSLGLTEAEALSIGAGFAVASNPHPSGDAYLQATGASAQAGGVFDGVAGLYDLTVAYFDETDGVSMMEVLVNGTVVASFDWGSTTGDAIVTAASMADYTVSGLVLAPGDVIELRGAKDGGEPLRTDYLEIAAAAAPALDESFVIEAEDLQIVSGFSVRSNGAASGREMLQHTSGDEARASYSVQQSGSFDLTIGYFDETDGVSWLQVLVNGAEVARFDWDGSGGASIASRASLVEEVIEGLALEAGDTIELVGQGDGGEPLRVDYLQFTSVAPGASGPSAPATLDLWYLRDGEVYVALNDGSGGFTELATGVTPDGTLRAVDMDGDGDLDFLDVAVVDPFPLPEATSPADEFIFEVVTTVYENDGSGGFTETTSDSTSFVAGLFGYPASVVDRLWQILQTGDAGDIDGDGDVDFAAVSVIAGRIMIFDNAGDDTFNLIELPVPEEVYDLSQGGNFAGLADMNDDGKLDLLLSVAWEFSSTLVMINDGAGGFDPVGSYGASDDGNSTEIPADLDGDGDLDVLFVAVSDGGGIYTYINDGTGARDAAAVAPSFPESELNGIGFLQIGDYDGDGKLEMVGASIEDGFAGLDAGLRLFEFPLEEGELSIEVASLDPSLVGGLTAQGDFDGDGDIDLILVAEESADTFVLINDGTARFTAVPTGLDAFSSSFPTLYAGELGDLLVA